MAERLMTASLMFLLEPGDRRDVPRFFLPRQTVKDVMRLNTLFAKGGRSILSHLERLRSPRGCDQHTRLIDQSLCLSHRATAFRPACTRSPERASSHHSSSDS